MVEENVLIGRLVEVKNLRLEIFAVPDDYEIPKQTTVALVRRLVALGTSGLCRLGRLSEEFPVNRCIYHRRGLPYIQTHISTRFVELVGTQLSAAKKIILSRIYLLYFINSSIHTHHTYDATHEILYPTYTFILLYTLFLANQ